MDGFYTSRALQRYQEHPNRSLYDKVMVLQSWSKNRGLQQLQRRDVAETEHPDVATKDGKLTGKFGYPPRPVLFGTGMEILYLGMGQV